MLCVLMPIAARRGCLRHVAATAPLPLPQHVVKCAAAQQGTCAVIKGLFKAVMPSTMQRV